MCTYLWHTFIRVCVTSWFCLRYVVSSEASFCRSARRPFTAPSVCLSITMWSFKVLSWNTKILNKLTLRCLRFALMTSLIHKWTYCPHNYHKWFIKSDGHPKSMIKLTKWDINKGTKQQKSFIGWLWHASRNLNLNLIEFKLTIICMYK